jgi:hypothetical protein
VVTDPDFNPGAPGGASSAACSLRTRTFLRYHDPRPAFGVAAPGAIVTLSEMIPYSSPTEQS